MTTLSSERAQALPSDPELELAPTAKPSTTQPSTARPGTRAIHAALADAEEALADSVRRLKFALAMSHTGGWDLDLIDQTTHRTLEHDRIFGYSSLLPKWTYEMFLEHVVPEDRAEVDLRFCEAIALESEWSFECRIRRADGEVRWIWAAGQHVRDESGQQRRMAGIVQDITERKQAATVMQRNAALERAIAEGCSVANIVTDTIGTIQLFNAGAELMLGYKAADVVNRLTPADLQDPVDVASRARALSRDYQAVVLPGFEALVFEARRGIRDPYPITSVHRDGRRIPTMLSVTLLREPRGATIGYLLTGTNAMGAHDRAG